MKPRLTYEVRLKKLNKKARSRLHKKWRWDVTYYRTTDPQYPGVENGREHLGGAWGYERFKIKAVHNIVKNVEFNPYKRLYEEV